MTTTANGWATEPKIPQPPSTDLAKADLPPVEAYERCSQEVLCLFMDMDASMRLPATTSTSTTPDDTSSTEHRRAGAPVPLDLQTLSRYEVVRRALKSFMYQKIATASSPATVHLALYGVWKDAVELLPPSPSDSPMVAEALTQYLGKANILCDDSASCGAFPFDSVAAVLRRTQAWAKASLDGLPGRSSTLVRGVVLLSRPGNPPPPQRPSSSSSSSSSAHDSSTWMDVVCIGADCPLPAPRAARRASSEVAKVLCPCAAVEPMAYTGIANMEMAVGAALTRLVGVRAYDPDLCTRGAEELHKMDIQGVLEVLRSSKDLHRMPSFGSIVQNPMARSGFLSFVDRDDDVGGNPLTRRSSGIGSMHSSFASGAYTSAMLSSTEIRAPTSNAGSPMRSSFQPPSFSARKSFTRGAQFRASSPNARGRNGGASSPLMSGRSVSVISPVLPELPQRTISPPSHIKPLNFDDDKAESAPSTPQSQRRTRPSPRSTPG